MTRRVEISTRAEADLNRNADWWAANHSVAEALEWAFIVRDQLRSLSESAESHGLSVESDEFPFEIRDQLVGKGRRRDYRAVFTIRDDVVYVLAVRRFAENRLRVEDVEHPD